MLRKLFTRIFFTCYHGLIIYIMYKLFEFSLETITIWLFTIVVTVSAESVEKDY